MGGACGRSIQALFITAAPQSQPFELTALSLDTKVAKAMKMLPIAAIALFALGGCAAPFDAKVSRFQQLAPPSGQSFVIQAGDPKLDGGIEFGQYAKIVSAKLANAGYRPATDPAHADLVVRMGYDVDKGREKTIGTGLSPYGGGFGFGYGSPYGRFGGPYGYYGRSRFAFGFYDPFLFDDDGVTSFTCHVGHAFSAESLGDGLDDRVEVAMWTAFRTLEESVLLQRRLADGARTRGLSLLARTHETRARAAAARAAIIQEALTGARAGTSRRSRSLARPPRRSGH